MICFVCKNSEWIDGAPGYRRCTSCGHELRLADQMQSYMVNEALSLDRVSRMDMRDRFQVALANRVAVERNMLLDVGSGSGRFLFHAKRHFKSHLGIEITEECIRFARQNLGLRIETKFDSAHEIPSLVTMWHSLEHLPIKEIESLLPELRGKLPPSGRVLISVPNGSSSHFKFFKSSSVYYDLANHIHQFSTQSLNQLMDKYGFRLVSSHASFMYAFFGSLLSYLNLFSPRHNFLYEEVRRKSGWNLRKIAVVGFYGVLSLFLVPLAATGYLMALINPKRGSVITMVFAPKP